MGMSVDFHVFSIKKLKAVLDSDIKVEKGLMKPSELLDKIMSTAGFVYEDAFILQSCDYWDDYDPWSNVLRVFERYYQFESAYEVFDKGQVGWSYDGVDEYDLYAAAGIDEETVKNHPYDEDEDE